MSYITEGYFLNKADRGILAKMHTAEMERFYPEEIKNSVLNTVVYSVDFNKKDYERKYDSSKVELLPIDSVSAVFLYSEGKTAVLNFASHKHPGGMFYEGSRAQEEGLCHESFLYNVLREHQPYYDWNNDHKNRALYVNRGLFNPDIRFVRDNSTIMSNVITCACPNKGSAQRWANVTDEENLEVLKSRIKFVLDIAADQDVDTLILGAFGCGVFRQDPYEVASIFKEFLSTTHKGVFKKVIFPIPPSADGNFVAFQTVFQN